MAGTTTLIDPLSSPIHTELRPIIEYKCTAQTPLLTWGLTLAVVIVLVYGLVTTARLLRRR